jgi:Domain of unknown function (DUF4388)/Gram-negative bacterial TonB protein C-terminal
MGLVANSRDLALHDLLQVKEMSRATCRVLVNGSGADGVLYVQAGEVVYAAYGELRGEEAAHAILEQSHVEYRVTSDALPPGTNMRARPAGLVMEAMRRLDEARRTAASEPATRSGVVRLGRKAPPAAAAQEARVPEGAGDASRSRPLRRSAISSAALAMLAGAVAVGGVLLARRAPPRPAEVAPETARPTQALQRASEEGAAVEASTLRPPADAPPVLLSGAPPRSPDASLALKPSIVCRLLVDRGGGVARATIYQQRPDLAAFEAAALDSVKQYRFEPARQSGQAVPVFINWPVHFE